MSKGYKESRGYGEESGCRETDRQEETDRERYGLSPGQNIDSAGPETPRALDHQGPSSPTNPMPDLSLMPQLPRLGAGGVTALC